MKYEYQRKDEINNLIKEYKETQKELKEFKNKNYENIGTIGLFILMIVMYVGFYFFGQEVLKSNYKFCIETEALENTM